MSFDDVEGLDHLGESLHTMLISTADPDSFLECAAFKAAAVVDPVATCAIAMMKDGRPVPIAHSDSSSRLLEQCQHDAGGGPTLAAMAEGEVVEVRDAAYDDRWPSYARSAVDLGVRCSLAVPLRIEGRTLGAITVHGCDRPGAFGPEERRRLERFAAQATTAIALAVERSDQQATIRQLEEALRARSVIDQAIGVLMAEERCAADAAFEMLRRHSQHNNRKIRDVAVDVVTRLTGHPPVDPAPFGATRTGMNRRSA